MNIVLTQKDADFILGRMRKELEGMSKDYEETAAKAKVVADMCSLLDKSKQDKAKGLLGELTEIYETQKNELLKIIELLTVGSEVTE